jgi:hypothetical protein
MATMPSGAVIKFAFLENDMVVKSRLPGKIHRTCCPDALCAYRLKLVDDRSQSSRSPIGTRRDAPAGRLDDAWHAFSIHRNMININI